MNVMDRYGSNKEPAVRQCWKRTSVSTWSMRCRYLSHDLIVVPRSYVCHVAGIPVETYKNSVSFHVLSLVVVAIT